MLIRIKNEIYNNIDDFYRRYRHTYLKLTDGNIYFVSSADNHNVYVQKLTWNKYKSDPQIEEGTITQENFTVLETAPVPGYFNIALENGGLIASKISYRHTRQQTQGLCNARYDISNKVSRHDLGRAYNGFYCSLIEACQHALLSGSCAISKNLMVTSVNDRLKLVYSDCPIGNINITGTNILPDFSEVFELENIHV